jgi:predicted secreted hydrolase
MKFKKVDAIIIIIMIVIAGFVLYRFGFVSDSRKEKIPEIEFVKDEDNRLITVFYVSERILWENLLIEGTCDKSELGRYVTKGDQIRDCSGTIVIRYKPTGTILFTFKFPPIAKLPTSIILGHMRDVSPEDEGAHFKKITNTREWWYFTAIFDDNSDLPGWSATIGFMHLSWGDLKGTFKPDVHVVVLTSPDGKKYGGLINKDRGGVLGLGVLGTGSFEANSPGVDLTYDSSYARGEAPRWHVHAEDKDIDSENEIIIELDFFAPSQPYWTHSNRLIDQGEGNFASYVFIGCEVSGKVILDKTEFNVKGIGHHEHAWSPGYLRFVIDGWDWCHMKLDNGWNIYYSKYYITKQRTETDTSRINPFTNLIITTDKGETLTILEDLDITIKRSDNLFLLLKMPVETVVTGKTKPLYQPLLKSSNIQLTLDINSENTYDKTWKIPTYVGMKIGLSRITGKISWNDENGAHQVQLNGIGSIWNMRKF